MTGRIASYVWAAPVTLLGLTLAVCGCAGGRLRIVDGVVEAHGWPLRWALTHLVPLAGGASALTLGHVVLGRDYDALARTRPHERVHVRQYERWGPAFLPAYAAATLWALARGRHGYLDNAFEREAFHTAPVARRRL